MRFIGLSSGIPLTRNRGGQLGLYSAVEASNYLIDYSGLGKKGGLRKAAKRRKR